MATSSSSPFSSVPLGPTHHIFSLHFFSTPTACKFLSPLKAVPPPASNCQPSILPPIMTIPSSAERALSYLLTNSHTTNNPAEALSLYIHALLLTHGFRPAETPATTTDTMPSQLPTTWTANTWGGRYRHNRSSLTFDITMTTVGTHLVVHAVAMEDEAEIYTAQLRLGDYVEGTITTEETVNWETVLQRRENVATLIQVQIAHRLVPDAAKEGYEAAAESNPTGNGTRGVRGSRGAGAANAPRQPFQDPLRTEPLRGDPLRMDPFREDPLRIGPPRRPVMPGMLPEFGGDDLLAPGLPRGPGIFGGGMGGNLMGPRNFPGMGGGGFGGLPEGVPPGARFDPYGPGVPDNDIERVPGFDDDHGMMMGGGRGRGSGRGRGGRGAGRGGGFGEGPPPGMYW